MMEAVLADRSLFLTEDGEFVVEEGDERASSCLVVEGQSISPRIQLMYGLALDGGRIDLDRAHSRDERLIPTEEDHEDLPSASKLAELGISEGR